MVQLGLVFSELDNTKNKLKIAKGDLKDAIDDNLEFANLMDQKKEITDKLKTIVSKIKGDNNFLLNEIESLSSEVKDRDQLLTDSVLSKLIKGENVNINVDGVEYIPKISIKYTKAN